MCVTGATGFLASHVVAQLLARGYRVRGTVRDPNDRSRTDHLRALARDQPDRLELVAAELLEPGGFDAAIAGCDRVVHMASPVLLTAADPQREIVDPAVGGTQNVFEAVVRAGTIRRVVMTSSIAAIRDEDAPPAVVLNEDHWNESASLERNPYPLAKTLAEREAWRRHDASDPGAAFDLITINPTVVLGPLLAPVHARGSVSFALEILRGRFPAAPRLQLSLVDVRDVALAHVEALERPGASGRYIAYNRGLWIEEIAGLLRPHFPDRRFPRRALPNWMMYVAALFEPRITFSYLRSHLGVERKIDNTKIRRELGISFRPIEDTLIDTCRSLIEYGLV